MNGGFQPSPRSCQKNCRRGGRAGRNIASGNPSAQEMKDGPAKKNTNKRRHNKDEDPEGEEGEYTTDQRAAETSIGHTRDHNKSQLT
jgi:hypothetical protein